MATDVVVQPRDTSMLDYRKMFWVLLAGNMLFFGLSTGHDAYLLAIPLAALMLSFALVTSMSKSKILSLVAFALLPMLLCPLLLTARDIYQQRGIEGSLVDTSTEVLLVDVGYSLSRVYETISRKAAPRVLPAILIVGIISGIIIIVFQKGVPRDRGKKKKKAPS